MAGRFQRGGQATISFFAFQDIITAVIGILIVVTLLMAMNLAPAEVGKSGPSTDEQPSSPELQARLDALLAELTVVNREAEELSGKGGETADPAAVAAEVTLLKQQIAALAERNSLSRRSASTVSGNMAGREARIEAEKISAGMAQQRASLAELRQFAMASQRAMADLEQQVKATESTLLGELDKKNVLRLIPEQSKTSKEPVLVLVTADEIVLIRFDSPERTRVRKPNEFGSALNQFSKLNQYLVFYVKPSGVDHFDNLVEKAKDAGFEVGYDVVGEKAEMEFGPSR